MSLGETKDVDDFIGFAALISFGSVSRSMLLKEDDPILPWLQRGQRLLGSVGTRLVLPGLPRLSAPSTQIPQRSLSMTDQISAEPFAAKKFLKVKGRRMAYIDEGEGAPIVFQHGNPTSSYLWRNVMPACKGLGRLIACDLIGMGDSDKLENSGPDRYTYGEQRSFLFALWEELKLGGDVVLVLHDWGSALGFDWANQNRSRVQGIAYMESHVTTFDWGVFTDSARPLFKAFRSSAGEDMVLRDNMFIEKFLPGAILRPLADAEMNEYRRPFLNAGEDRRPMLSWPRQIPIDGSPSDVAEIVTAYSQWLSQSQTPKLYIHADPGAMDKDNGKFREFCKKWPNQKEATVKGIHYLQEDSGPEIGAAVAEFVRGLRKKT
jgi:haloalkane dehalogenase